MKNAWMTVAAVAGLVLWSSCSSVGTDGDNGLAVTSPGEPAYHGRNYRDNALMADASGKALKIHVSIDNQKGTLFVDGKKALVFPLSTGIPGHSTPKGNFKIYGKELVHYSSLYGSIYNDDGKQVVRYADRRKNSVPAGAKFSGAPMPYTMWFSGSCALHEGEVPDPPMLASHGCIHLPQEVARELYELCPVGMTVTVSN